MTPQERTILITAALKRTFGYTPEEAEGILMEHDADVIHEVLDETRTLKNPYRWYMGRTKWADGASTVDGILFMKELRLRMKAVRKATKAITDRQAAERG
jgi:hypothetical protein